MVALRKFYSSAWKRLGGLHSAFPEADEQNMSENWIGAIEGGGSEVQLQPVRHCTNLQSGPTIHSDKCGFWTLEIDDYWIQAARILTMGRFSKCVHLIQM